MDSRPIVLVCCPQKVGSTALISSLRISACDKLFTLHTHGDIIFSNVMPQTNLKVTDVIKNANIRPIYLIDIFRTPVEQKISEFFHEINTLHFNNTIENIQLYPIEKINTRLFECWDHLGKDDFYNTMFVEHGATPIPEDYDWKLNPYYISKNNNITFIKLRLQDSHLWDKILSNVFNIPIVIVKDYTTESRITGAFYKKFCNDFRLPNNLFLKLIQCNELKKYLTTSERNEYFEKWMDKQVYNINPPNSFNEAEYEFYTYISKNNQFYYRPLVKHYLDDGCLCSHCSIQRKKCFHLARLGAYNIPTVWHSHQEESDNRTIINVYDGDVFNPIVIKIIL
jgi:hypothetical protein